MWDLAPHDISIIRYILEKEPETVSAFGRDYIIKGKHDIAYVSLSYADGTMAHIHVSWLDPNKVRRMTLVGSKKMLVYDDVDPLNKIHIYDKGVDKLEYTDSFEGFNCSYRYGDIITPHIKYTEPLKVECQHFFESISDYPKSPLSDGRVGLAVVKVLEAADHSLAANNQPVIV